MRKVAFISYSSQDKSTAEQICGLLEKKGIGCWIAPRDAKLGRNYGEEIISGIETSCVMVLVLSEHANQSVHVRHEVERAFSKGKPVLAIRIQEVQPAKSLELYISSTQWVDAWTPPLEAKVGQLAAAIGELAGIRLPDPSSLSCFELQTQDAEIVMQEQVQAPDADPVEQFLHKVSSVKPLDREMLIGRDDFLGKIRDLLEIEPVLCVYGPTGIGKTAIGLRLIRDMADAGIPTSMGHWAVPDAKENGESLLIIEEPRLTRKEMERWLASRPLSQKVIFLSRYHNYKDFFPGVWVPPLSDEFSYDLLTRLAAAIGLSINPQGDQTAKALCKMAGGIPLNLQMLAGCLEPQSAEEFALKAKARHPKGGALGAQEFHDLIRSNFGEAGDILLSALRRLPAGLAVRSLGAFLETKDWARIADAYVRTRLARNSGQRLFMGEVLAHVRGSASFYSLSLARHMTSFFAKYTLDFGNTGSEAGLDELDLEWPNIQFALQQAESFHEWPTVIMMCEAMFPYIRARGKPQAANDLESRAAFAADQPPIVEEISMAVGPGEIDLFTASEMRTQFEALLGQCKPGMILSLDISKVDYFDSSGLGVLVRMEKLARERDVNMHLLLPSLLIRRMFAITGLDKVFDILPWIPYSEIEKHILC